MLRFLPRLRLLLFLAVAFAPLCANAQGPGAGGAFGGKRVLLIGIDGLRPDVLQRLMEEGKAPCLKKIIEGGAVTWRAYAGGQLGTPTQQPTVSGPGWTSIHTGVYIDRHHVDNNETPPCDDPKTPGSYLVTQAPHFARYLKDARPSVYVSSISSWAWIEDYLVASQPSLFKYHAKGAGKDYGERDLDVTIKTVAHLGSADPDVLLLHFDQADGAGHATGFTSASVEYRAAIIAIDKHVGEVMAAIEKRPGHAAEKWLTIVTTDHGGLNKSHGGQTRDERNILLAVNGAGISAGQTPDEMTGHAAVAPTIFKYLGVPVDPAWRWAEKPFGLPDPAAK